MYPCRPLASNFRFGIRGVFYCCCLFACSCPSAAAVQDVTDIEVEVVKTSDSDFEIEVTKLPTAEVESAEVRVWLQSADSEQLPPMTGTTIKSDGNLRFQPRFPLRRGKAYRVRLSSANFKATDYLVEIPAPDIEPTRVLVIHPTADQVPANMLKFYVHFSAPMRQGDIYDFVRLRKASGEEIELPFLEIEQEFWSRDAKRLTLLLDPGRIKRGLKPREEMGPIFEPGGKYELVISGKWKDGNGNPLGTDVIKSFSALEEDFDLPDPANWKINPPKQGTRQPLVIQFGEPLDHSIAQRAFRLRNLQHESVVGDLKVSADSTRLEFSPGQPWSEPRFELIVDTTLEDLAGNSLGKQFDVDVVEQSTTKTMVPTIKLPIVIGD